jgi:hypothetical protein
MRREPYIPDRGGFWALRPWSLDLMFFFSEETGKKVANLLLSESNPSDDFLINVLS